MNCGKLVDMSDCLINEESTTSLDPTEIFLEEEANRKQRRNGPFGRDGYKRPRNNKNYMSIRRLKCLH